MERLLAEHYDLNAIPLASLSGGLINQLWRVGEELVIKRYNPRYFPRDRVVLSTEGQRFLAERGHPVPRIIPNRAGSLLTGVDGVWHVLHTLQPGSHRARGEQSGAVTRQRRTPTVCTRRSRRSP